MSAAIAPNPADPQAPLGMPARPWWIGYIRQLHLDIPLAVESGGTGLGRELTLEDIDDTALLVRMTADERGKLAAIAEGAEVNVVTSVAGDTGDVTLDAADIAETDALKILTADERTKLAGIAEGAQVNTVTSVAGRTGAVVLELADIGGVDIRSVADYGAVGDGVTDDTDAIQAAIDDGGVVILSANETYLITQITITNRVFLIGNGATLKNTENRQNYPLVISSNNTVVYDLNIHVETTATTEHGSGVKISADNVTLDRVYVYADHQDCGYLNGGSFAVWIDAGSDDVVLRDIRVHNFAYGLRFYGGAIADITYRSFVSNFTMTGSNVIGVFISNARDAKFNGITIEGVSSVASTVIAANTAGKNGILISPDTGVENILFSNVSVRDTLEHCIRIGGLFSYTRGISFNNVSTKNAGRAASIGGAIGLKLGGDTSTPAYNIVDVVINNFRYEQTHTDQNGYGMAFYRCDKVSVSNVVISGLADKRIRYGVSFEGAKNIRFANAVISNTFTTGLFVYGYYSASGDFGTNENVVISNVSVNNGGSYGMWLYTNATAENTKEIKNLIVTDIEVNDTTYCIGNSLSAYCTLTNAHIDRWRLVNTGGAMGGFVARGTYRQHWSNAAPTTGAWVLGERVHNSEPSAGEYEGWICTTAGTPGTWKGFGVIAQ